MNTYKIKLKHEQIKYFYQSLNVIFVQDFVKNNIDHVTFYNIKSLLKRLHDKLYHLSNVRIIKSFKYTFSIDYNEHKALIEVTIFGKSIIDENPYLNILYMDILSMIDKQELEIREQHRKEFPPPNVDIYKYQIDFNKST